MKRRCIAPVEAALGRPLRDGEADIVTARLVNVLREDAKDRKTWNGRAPFQRLRAAGDRIMRDLPDAALAQERAKTEAMQQRLEAIEREMAQIHAAAKPDTRFALYNVQNAAGKKQMIIRNPSARELHDLTHKGAAARYYADEYGDYYVWPYAAFASDAEAAAKLEEIGARLKFGQPEFGTLTRSIKDNTLETVDGSPVAAITAKSGRAQTYNQEEEWSGWGALEAAYLQLAAIDSAAQMPDAEATGDAGVDAVAREQRKREADAAKAHINERIARLEQEHSDWLAANHDGFRHSGEKPGGRVIVRGSTTFHRDAGERIVASTMRLTEAANLATFLHESGHIFLEIVRELANHAEAPADVRQMWADITDWLGVAPQTDPELTRLRGLKGTSEIEGERLYELERIDEQKRASVNIETAHHELFARTFEAYLRDGKAPTTALQRAFDTFKKWLTKIYQSIALNHNLTPEIASVFDRIIASDEEIAKARAVNGQATPLFANAEQAGMTPEEWKSYQQKRADAEAQARASLTATAMDAYYRQQTAWWNRQLGKARRKAAKQIDTAPSRRAFDWLAFGKWRGEVARADRRNGEEMEPEWGFVDAPADLAKMSINLAAVAEDYGPSMVAALPDELRPVDDKEVEELVRQARRAKAAGNQKKQPRRLASFVVQFGGLRDDGGDVLAILGSHRARPGLINNANGKSIDDVALAAWEAGYFGAKPAKGTAGGTEFFHADEAPKNPMRSFRDVDGKPYNADREAVNKLNRLFSRDRWHDVELPIGRLIATQTSVNPDFKEAAARWVPEGHGLPAVVKYNGKYYVTDGHHRIVAKAEAGASSVRVRLYDIDGNTQTDFPLLDVDYTPIKLTQAERDLLEELDAHPTKPGDTYFAADQVGRPTIAQFLEALEADLRGEPIYKVEDLEDVWASEEDRQAGYWFDQRGIDIGADAKTLREQIKHYLLTQGKGDGALHPDVIAAEFNRVLGIDAFPTGHDLLKALSQIEPRRQLVEQLAAKMVRDEYGDPYEDTAAMEQEAQKAAHRALNARVLELELEALSKASDGNARAVSRAARQMAQQRVAALTVRQVRAFDKFLAMERKHARAAADAMAKGNVFEAALEKRAQLIAFHTWAEARDAAAALDVMERKFKSFDSPNTRKTIDPKVMRLIDGVLEQFELRRISLREEDRRIALLDWVEQMTAKGYANQLAIASDLIKRAARQSFGRLTFEEAKDLDETIRNLEHLGRLKQGLLIKRERARIQEVENEIVASIENNGPTHKPAARERFTETELERTHGGVQQFHAENTKAEFLFRYLDGLKDNGPVWRHLFRPLAEAEAAELEMQALAAARTNKIFSKYTKKERERMFRVKTVMPKIGVRMTKANMIAVALNYGNEYSRDVLRAGYGWTHDQVMSIINELDKRELDTVQEIWDWLEEYREPTFALAERLTGVRPKAVEASPLVTYHGVYRGGYYRIKYDPRHNVKTKERDLAQSTIDQYGENLVRPATKKGMTLERKGSGGQQVRVDLNVLQEHIAETIHYITHEEAVLDTAKLLAREGIQQSIVGAVGIDQYFQLKGWLKDIARMPKPPTTSFERLMSKLNDNVSVVAMGWKVSTAIVQPIGITGAIPRLGAGAIAAQVTKLYGRPDRIPAAFQFVFDRSSMMRHRVDTYDRDVRDAMKSVSNTADGDPIPVDVRRSFFWLTSTFQMGVDIPVWLAAYNKAMGGQVENIDKLSPNLEDQAIQYADSVVRMTQGSGSIKDQTTIMRQRGFMRLFTKFYSYFGTLYNQLYNEQMPGMRIGKIPFPVFFVNMVWLWFAPAIIAQLMTGQNGDDDDLLAKLAVTTAAYPLMTIVGVRDVVNGTISNYGYEMTPVAAVGDTFAGVGQDVLGGKITERTLKQAWMGAGYWYGLPSRQVWITFDYAKDVAGGIEDPAQEPGRIWSEGLVRDTR